LGRGEGNSVKNEINLNEIKFAQDLAKEFKKGLGAGWVWRPRGRSRRIELRCACAAPRRLDLNTSLRLPGRCEATPFLRRARTPNKCSRWAAAGKKNVKLSFWAPGRAWALSGHSEGRAVGGADAGSVRRPRGTPGPA
jgi:hypothetical protein